MSNFQAPQRKKNALDNSSLRLNADGNGGKAPSLQVIVAKNNVKFQIYTNDPNDTKDYGKITAIVPLLHFQCLLQMIKIAAAGKTEYRKFLEVKQYTYPNGKRSEAPTVTARVIIGCDADGLMWISVTAAGRPNIKFPFIPTSFNSIRNGDSSEVTPAEYSQLYAVSWAKVMERLVAHIAVIEFEEYIPKNNNNNGGNGGGGNRGNGGGYGGGNNNSGGGNSGGATSGGDVGNFDGW